MIILQNLTYLHPNKDVLFSDLTLTVNRSQKVALAGNNGIGKSTLLKLMAGDLLPAAGIVRTSAKPYYVPQHFGQFDALTIAQALQIEQKLNALKAILNGHVTEANLSLLDDDWALEERCLEALQYWGLEELDLSQPMGRLSGGQKTKVFLAGIDIHQAEIVLLDEPSNHLDAGGRHLLYDLIQASSATLVVVSHDRTLLNLLPSVYELSTKGIKVYGGNYAFYREQKKIECNALNEDVRSKEKALRKARETARETAERQQKLDARGKKKQEKEGLPTIAMNTFRNNAEKSTARLKGVHDEKTGTLLQELNELRKELPGVDKMKFGFDQSTLHKGKILITVKDINHDYSDGWLWQEGLNFQVTSGERIALKGGNGSGKTTLIRILLGEIKPEEGKVLSAIDKTVYIDQDYSLINPALTVYEQAAACNQTHLQEHEVKIRLSRFLFTKEDWNKPCHVLSGGEKMRLSLCCLSIANQAPDLIILDEPTNNLDIQNTEILTAAINEYQGTLIVVSHDEYFLKEVNVARTIALDKPGKELS